MQMAAGVVLYMDMSAGLCEVRRKPGRGSERSQEAQDEAVRDQLPSRLLQVVVFHTSW